METESVQCPFCGQEFELAVDTSVASQQCEAGEIISLDVVGAS
jgi:hypothetical protein